MHDHNRHRRGVTRAQFTERSNKWKPPKQTAELGYVLIVHRKGFRATEVHGRYSHNVVEEAKRRVEQRDDVNRVVIEDADVFQARECEEAKHRPWYNRLHDDWGQPLDVLADFPLVNTLREL